MRIKIQTSLGDIIVRLYDETPRHRDNFVKLAKEGYFDGTLFHRVIKDFMIQGGDPDSKGAPAGKNLGTGGPDYTIPAEFVYPQLFHKRGALSAARTGDEVNPNRESSGSQFYIVWGKTTNRRNLSRWRGRWLCSRSRRCSTDWWLRTRQRLWNSDAIATVRLCRNCRTT